jgi:hypothetical protein
LIFGAAAVFFLVTRSSLDRSYHITPSANFAQRYPGV